MPHSFGSTTTRRRLEALDHLDADRPDRGVGAVDELLRRPHHAVLVAPPDGDERVLRAEVRVLAEPDHAEQFVGASRGG